MKSDRSIPGRSGGRHGTSWLPTLLALGLAGCASSPPVELDLGLDLPPGWTANASSTEPSSTEPSSTEPVAVGAEPVVAPEADDATPVALPPSEERWWADFGDEALETLILEALDHNRDLDRAVAAVEAARAQARLAGADRLPQVSADLSGSKRQQVFIGLPIPGRDGPLKSRSSTWSGGVAISWEADLWGRLGAGQRAAVGDLQASEAELAAARLALAGQVARSWFGLLETEGQLALARDIAESRQRTRQQVERRYRQGLAPSVELRLARANEARAQATVEQVQGQSDAVRRQLEVLVGRYPAGRLSTGGDVETGLPAPPPPIPPGLPAEIVARRPDLRASEARLVAAGQRLAEARAAFYPRLTLSGSLGSSSDSIGHLLDGDFSVWSLAGGLLQPIFQGGRLRAAADLADAGREAALADHAQALLRAFAEVEVALGAERWLAAEQAHLAMATEEGRAAATLAEDRYRAGVGDYLSVLESQRQAFGNEAALLSVQRQRLVNRVDLHLALGGAIPRVSASPGHETPADPAQPLTSSTITRSTLVPSSTIHPSLRTDAMEAPSHAP